VVKCANCSRDNPDGTVICLYCGQLVDPTRVPQQVQTRKFGESDSGENQPRWGTARFDEQTQLILRVADSSQILHVDITKPGGALIGRYDSQRGEVPEVDLAPFNAMDLGVSRQHARLTVHEDSRYIPDRGSANATYLNGLRLTPHQPRILRDSDEIRLGRLKLQVTFVDAKQSD